MRTWVVWMLSALLCVALISGCGGGVSDEELGEPVRDMADAPGADEPYDLDQLLPKEEGKANADGE